MVEKDTKKFKEVIKVECRDKDGKLKWVEYIDPKKLNINKGE